ncbi:MAG TPA: hypothetical protein VH020_11300 [Stellaceae bacterium]|jgi:hypothetical protein|nr:hypothetical protein [Stellaceae bacterium]
MNPIWANDLVDRTSQKLSVLPQNSGFAVFYCPVPEQADFLILGFNPGGGPEDSERKGAIPEEHEYLSCDYRLARATRDLFAQNDYLGLLKQSVKSNLQFFRTKNVVSWNQIAEEKRHELTEFCDQGVREIVGRLRPKAILLEGVQTFDAFRSRIFCSLLCEENSSETRLDGRRVYVSQHSSMGLIIGILHLSGARPRASAADKALISEKLKSDLCSVGFLPESAQDELVT